MSEVPLQGASLLVELLTSAELEKVAASAEIEWLHAGHVRADCRISSLSIQRKLLHCQTASNSKAFVYSLRSKVIVKQ